MSVLLTFSSKPMKQLSIPAAILAACGFSFGLISPAHAAPVACSPGGFGNTWMIDGAGNLESMNGALGADGCFIGDKVYSDFLFTGITSGIYTFTQSGANHTFSGTGLNFTGSSFSYRYKVSLFNPVAGQEFVKYNTDAAGSAGAPVFTKSLQTGVNPAMGPVTGPSTADENGAGAEVLFNSGETGPVYFSSTLNLTANKIDQITDSLDQKFEGTTSVPGPLPLLGVGAAFGLSRRLRNRIKLAS